MAASAAEMGHREAEALMPGTLLRRSSPSPVSAPLHGLLSTLGTHWGAFPSLSAESPPA